MTILTRSLTKVYDSAQGEHIAVHDVTLSVASGQFVSIVGASGSGKTTLARMIAGLVRPTSGTISIDDQVILAPPRSVTMVSQDYSKSLMPWKTVLKNVEMGRKNFRERADVRDTACREMLSLVGLSRVADQYPYRLSGGMQQRVALARALAFCPKILVLDEPFSSLDTWTRFALQEDLLRIVRDRGLSVVHVTHDLDEAVYMSDRIVVLHNGRITEEVIVDLPEPREHLRTRSLQDFASLRTRLYEATQVCI